MKNDTPTSTLIILDLKSPLFIFYNQKMKKLKRQTGQSIPPRVEIAECNLPSNSWITAVCRAASTSGAPKIARTSTWATHLAPPSRTSSDGVGSHPMVRCHACHYLTSQLADEGPAFRVTIRLAVLPKPVLQGVAVKKSSNASKEMISAKLPGEVLQRAQTFRYLQSTAQTINGYGFSWKSDTPLYCCTGVVIWML